MTSHPMRCVRAGEKTVRRVKVLTEAKPRRRRDEGMLVSAQGQQRLPDVGKIRSAEMRRDCPSAWGVTGENGFEEVTAVRNQVSPTVQPLRTVKTVATRGTAQGLANQAVWSTRTGQREGECL